MAVAPRAFSAPPILSIVAHHVDESAFLRRQRSRLVRAPHIRLHLLQRHDARIAAHLDGIAVAGGAGCDLAMSAALKPGGSELFTAATIAISMHDAGAIDRLIDVGRGSLDASRMLLSAAGWASATDLREFAKGWLASSDPHTRALGLGACAMHEVDPGPALRASVVNEASEFLASRAIEVAARLARGDLLSGCLARLAVGDPLRVPAAVAALLLGERQHSVATLHDVVARKTGETESAIEWLLLALQPARSGELMGSLSKSGASQRTLIRSAGLSGQTKFIPWLLEKCGDMKVARIAAESFSLITGLDIDGAGMSAPMPEGWTQGPSDDAKDDNVALDEDEDLLWPDVAKLKAWWLANGARFDGSDRWFCGARLTSLHCESILRVGRQRERRLAARHRALIAPGVRLFNVAAPAWRQQRQLTTPTA